MAYDNTNRFTLGRNRKKEKETQADFTGKMNIDGVEYWLNAWVKEHNGEKFFSGSVKAVEQREGGPRPFEKKQVSSLASDIDDSIPFAPEWR